MAHGTGYYSIPLWDHIIKTDEYAVTFYRTRYYWYPMMSDCYEPTWEWRDNYNVVVTKWRKDRYGHTVADCASESHELRDISRDEANKIWWNLKNRNISFGTVGEYFDGIKQKRLQEYAEEANKVAFNY